MSEENLEQFFEQEENINLNEGIDLEELQEKWHFASLERIFIENRIYHKIEELEEWDLVISTIQQELKSHISHLLREVTDDDVVKLTEIKIKRITKFDLNKALKFSLWNKLFQFLLQE